MRLLWWMGQEEFGRGGFSWMRRGWWLGGERGGRLGLRLRRVRGELRRRILWKRRRTIWEGGGRNLLFQGCGMKDLRGWWGRSGVAK